MIGFNALGHLGRLGNQMFQFAALKGIAKNRGFEYCFPPSGVDGEWKDHHAYYDAVGKGQAQHLLFQPFKLSTTSELNVQFIDPKRPTACEAGFTFDENIFERVPDWVSLQGFFQTEKYFKHIREDLLQDFAFKDEIFEPCREMIDQFEQSEQIPISLHVRRTDYATNPNHSVLDLEYYSKALESFDDNQMVLVFSDDPAWCNQQKLFEGGRFLIAEGNSTYVDLCLMTMCKGHIIANSSFSWWGAWLANSEKVIAPSGWFKGSNLEGNDTSDLIPEEWEVI